MKLTNTGKNALKEFMESNDGSNKFFFLHWPTLRKALKTAGWTVRKAKTEKLKLSDSDLLAELGV